MYEVVKNYLLEKDNKVYFKGAEEYEMVFYIPDEYFESEFAVYYGESIALIGIFNYAIFKNGKPVTDLLTFKFPSRFICKPCEVENVKEIKLLDSASPSNYTLLKFRNGDEIICNTQIPKNIDNLELFIKLFTSGKFPTTISYDKIQDLFVENMRLNSKTYEATTQLIGVVISEMARSLNDSSIPYRLSKFNPKQTNYNMVNIKDIPRLASPFTAVTSENWDESLANAMINKNPKDSPLERLFMH